ncbi:hypothetical protein PIB30_010371 [Stylosanthes scabra]|uniref:Secreted protein n=1 Tax=Stylosanthes scabra TaxID=79078 RepID=A0ABU6W4W2_9FABA|nr:hypothetical protein [Stylosanthes scabra]
MGLAAVILPLSSDALLPPCCCQAGSASAVSHQRCSFVSLAPSDYSHSSTKSCPYLCVVSAYSRGTHYQHDAAVLNTPRPKLRWQRHGRSSSAFLLVRRFAHRKEPRVFMSNSQINRKTRHLQLSLVVRSPPESSFLSPVQVAPLPLTCSAIWESITCILIPPWV